MMGLGRIAGTGAKWLAGAGIAALATMAVAQTAPGQDSQNGLNNGLDLPSTLEIFGKADPNVRKPTAIVNDYVITGTEVDQRVALVTGASRGLGKTFALALARALLSPGAAARLLAVRPGQCGPAACQCQDRRPFHAHQP